MMHREVYLFILINFSKSSQEPVTTGQTDAFASALSIHLILWRLDRMQNALKLAIATPSISIAIVYIMSLMVSPKPSPIGDRLHVSVYQ